MRGFIATLCCLLCFGVAQADDAALLLADRTALVPPDAPPALIEYLVAQHHALIYQPANPDYSVPDEFKSWIISLPQMPMVRQSAAETIAAWVAEYGIDIAVLPGHPPGTQEWRAALDDACTIFEPVYEFQPGDIALPSGDNYLFYRGPRPVFFPAEPAALEDLIDRHAADDATLTGAERRLATDAGTLRMITRENPGFGVAVLQPLAQTILAAESLAVANAAVAPVAQEYIARWRSILSDRIALVVAAAQFAGLAGTGGEGTLTVESHAPVAIQLDSVATSGSDLQVSWSTPLPETVTPGGRVTLDGRCLAQAPGLHTVTGGLYYSYEGVDCVMPVTIIADLVASLDIEFDPPILYLSDAQERSDPDYRMKLVAGMARLINRTRGNRQLMLTWFAEDPVSLSTLLTEITLKSNEVRSIPIALSVPLDWNGRALDYGVKIEEAGHIAAVGTGHLWQQPAALDGKPQVAVIGDAGVWLAALNAVNISAIPIAIDYLTAADLSPFRAVIISGDAPAPSTEMREALRELARRGRRIIIDLSPASTAWLPWPTELDHRPAPTSAKFFKEGHPWWIEPNRLIGDCFAATKAGDTYTLPAGAAEWEPLVTDEGGKGFMYRRAEGEGWYVVVHDAWKSGLETLERLPMMGLINLAGRAIR